MDTPREPLKTDRLVLEPLAAEHGEAVWAAVEPSLPELQRWLGWTKDLTREKELHACAAAVGAWNDGSYTFMLIENGELIGGCGAHIRPPHPAQAEIGYWMRSDRAGQGFATEASRAVRDFAFDTLGLVRLALRAGVENIGSCRVAEKIGFQREGMMRLGAHGAFGSYDSYLYGMLATDPRP